MDERYALAVTVLVLLALMMRADDCGRASAQDRQDNAPAIVPHALLIYVDIARGVLLFRKIRENSSPRLERDLMFS